MAGGNGHQEKSWKHPDYQEDLLSINLQCKLSVTTGVNILRVMMMMMMMTVYTWFLFKLSKHVLDKN